MSSLLFYLIHLLYLLYSASICHAGISAIIPEKHHYYYIIVICNKLVPSHAVLCSGPTVFFKFEVNISINALASLPFNI